MTLRSLDVRRIVRLLTAVLAIAVTAIATDGPSVGARPRPVRTGASSVLTWKVSESFPAYLTGRDEAIACPSVMRCFAVGPGQDDRHSDIRSTTDGGASWKIQVAPDSKNILRLSGIACPSASTCYVVGTHFMNGGLILATFDAGRTWTYQASSQPLPHFVDISCPSTNTCFASGRGEIVTTTNSGSAWTVLSRPHEHAISCPTTSVCYAAADTFPTKDLVTTDGWKTWRVGTFAPQSEVVSAIACPSTTACYALGYLYTPVVAEAAVFATSDSGRTWSTHAIPPGISANLSSAIACPSENTCYSAGHEPSQSYATVVVSTTDSGNTWNPQTLPSGVVDVLGLDCPSSVACYAVGMGQFDGLILKGTAP
jgi:hypothetical protein